MTLFSLWNWLKPLQRQAAVCRHRRHHLALRARFVPQLETLEDRTVPSTLTVTNNLDTSVAGDGSLRGEIAAAQSGDTIVFAPSLAGQTVTLTSGELAINKSLDIEGLGVNQLRRCPAISVTTSSRECWIIQGIQLVTCNTY
jgi:hypothetical protein